MSETQTLPATHSGSATKTQWCRLEPVDAWFFRDGRPSNRGEEQSDIASQFPPNPATVVGALRAALARSCPHDWNGRSDWPDEIKQVLGDGDDLGSLAFTGPLLEKDGQLVFPMPAHVVGHEVDGGKNFQPLDWLVPAAETSLCDLGEVRLPTAKGLHQCETGAKHPGSTDRFFVTASGMEMVLAGELPSPDDCIHREKLFVMEGRIGIARDVDSRTTGEKAMYSPRYVRLQPNVALVTGVAGLPENGWEFPRHLALGGESRLASCERIDEPAIPAQCTGESATVLVLTTPAQFTGEDGPWYGAGPDDEANRLCQSLTGRVRTAAFDRPIGIGGWDSVRSAPLPMTPHVRSGAVWWLETTPDDSVGQTFFRIGRRTNFGYGLALVGRGD